MSWFIENMGTIVVGLLLAAAVVAVICKMVSDKKKGKGGCGCGCENCPSRGQCH